MSVSSFSYQLLIGPLEIIFEVIYGLSHIILNDYGLSILVLSLAMNLLLLPLYRRADAIQNEERVAEQKMEKGVAHIKKTFKGDERFMMLQTYYRQYGYKPFYVLKGFLPLVLEIPFFIAAYHFLSNYEPLIGTSFGPIADLGAPDRLLNIAGKSINLLPVLMTVINYVSSAIYTKGFPLKDKLQLYGMAAVFLVLLYSSPSGLVLYWTLNNLFSLIKNLLGRIKNCRTWLKAALLAAGAAVLVYGLGFYHTEFWKHRLAVVLIGFCMMMPAVWTILNKKNRLPAVSIPETADPGLFLCGCLFMALLTGVLIPSAVIRSSPEEFVHMVDYYSPLRHVLNASLLSVGLFVVWCGIFYYLLNDRAKWIFGLAIWVVSGAAVVNYMFFGTKLGLISSELQYEDPLVFSVGETWLNLAILLVLAVVLSAVYLKKQKLTLYFNILLIAAIFGMSAMNLAGIHAAAADMKSVIDRTQKENAHFTMSRKGNNVVFLMLDRAISAYLPYIFEEKPELREQFSGFTYYPNTVSYGAHTLFASAALYGGYEYTPEEINRRADEPLVDKHNEALKVLPVMFSQAGYRVTVCDPPFAGYQWIPDLSIYDDCPEIASYITEQGQFSTVENVLDRIWRRNFFCYSMMKCLPVAVQPSAYQYGSYFGTYRNDSLVDFDYSYSVLKALTSITEITDGDENTFLSLCNSTTHKPRILSEPEYEPAEEFDNSAYDAEHPDRSAAGEPSIRLSTYRQRSHYHVNAAALTQIGAWLDYLREKGVYDNTRIIIVADHGSNLNQFPELLFTGESQMDDVMLYNPLLLVKDFNSTDSLTDDTFMTNADAPVLACRDLIPDPKNPFTGKPFNNDRKAEPEQLIFTSHNFDLEKNAGCTFYPGYWYAVHDDIFDVSNWTLLGKW